MLRRSFGLCSPSIRSQSAPDPAMTSVVSGVASEHQTPMAGVPAANARFSPLTRSSMIVPLKVSCQLSYIV